MAQNRVNVVPILKMLQNEPSLQNRLRYCRERTLYSLGNQHPTNPRNPLRPPWVNVARSVAHPVARSVARSAARSVARSATHPTGHTDGFDGPSLLGAQVSHRYRIIVVDDVQVARAVLIHSDKLVGRGTSDKL